MKHPTTERQVRNRGFAVMRYHTDEGYFVGYIVKRGPKRILFHFAGEGVERYVPIEEEKYMTKLYNGSAEVRS